LRTIKNDIATRKNNGAAKKSTCHTTMGKRSAFLNSRDCLSGVVDVRPVDGICDD
jgi:hypothetical protein